MHDPTEPDRQEILSGPGDVRLAEKSESRRPRAPKNTKKTIVIAASALAAVLAAGGVGYMLAAGPTAPATQDAGGRPAPSESAAIDPNFQDDDATMGDVTTDAPEDGLPDDGSMGDPAADPGPGDPAADTGSRGSDPEPGTGPSRGTAQTGDSKKPATSSPTAPPQSSAGDNPADGPAGEVTGQCAASGC
ncbi:hypothetical protein [Nonomuraea sp. SYSU D8015]|uniref:hypothetical protein n=1 Tax=Nonomuraea sp. SYSU D8015 TaxID=2593644 RepID=UPI001660243D|nr:hypothetical protein [Nonomuraea sp. SYSU D8015]